jgi:hypothetical protein
MVLRDSAKALAYVAHPQLSLSLHFLWHHHRGARGASSTIVGAWGGDLTGKGVYGFSEGAGGDRKTSGGMVL